jgi:putative oxidoreductase
MPFITFGRVLFAVLFIYLGAEKLFDIKTTAKLIGDKVTIPSILMPYVDNLQTLTQMEHTTLLAILIGGFEVLAGLMIALNFGARFFAILLIFLVAVSTYYFYNFWAQPAPGDATMVVDALKNLAIIGALFMIAGYGRGRRAAEPAYGDV